MAGEFDLIDRIRARAGTRGDVVLGIGDDAALLSPPPGMQLAFATDTLNIGVHFPPETAPRDIGWKALAVNLSDLAAMGAIPAWCGLSLSMPQADEAWIDGFIDGFAALAGTHDVALVGGDTTRGPLSVCASVIGLVEPARAMRRDGAQAGDDVWVSGTLGDAAAALWLWQSGREMSDALRERLDRPVPRVALGRALRKIAHACIDVSDGLLADLAHVCAASGAGAEIDIDALPASPGLMALAKDDAAWRRLWQATGGDDYELCFTAPETAADAVAGAAAGIGARVTRIGRIVQGCGIRARAGGSDWHPAVAGHQHFVPGQGSRLAAS